MWYWYENKLCNEYLEFCLFFRNFLCTHGYTIHRRSEGTINIKRYVTVQNFTTFWKEHEKNSRWSKVKTSACGADISIYFIRLAHWVMSSRCQTFAASGTCCVRWMLATVRHEGGNQHWTTKHIGPHDSVTFCSVRVSAGTQAAVLWGTSWLYSVSPNKFRNINQIRQLLSTTAT